MAKKQSGYDFEKSLAELEKLVEQMESGELSLDQSLEAFEKGIKLTRECQQMLEKSEQKVQMLIKRHGDVQAVPFDGDNPQTTDAD